ncbi:MAG: LamG-like jellyroll fold domain-containing protein, partial [Bacteroidaceae bacterium]|nr:LamG-like jellyroll fold domain-containing protein [Bacteroidaceae bacterium]
ISLNKAFEAGRHDNRLVLLAQEGDTIRLGVKHTYFNGGANDWVGIGDIHLTYHGEMEDSEEAIDRALESMLARANSLQGIEFKSDADYGKYPNYSKTIQDRLAAAIEKGNGAADVATKYEVIEELSAVFKEAIESKMAYKHYFAEVEKVVNYAYLAYEMDEVKYKELAAAAAAIQEEGIIAYENGSLSTEEANECAVAKTVDVYPTIDENGTYHVANTAQMAYVTDMIKGGNNAINVTLDGDVYFNTSMMMTDFYGDLDGQDHTITVNIERTADNAAIFENIRGSEIKNLIVRGSIVTPNKYAAAIAAHAHDACKIYRVQSWVDIQGNIAGDGTHAGIIAVNESGNLDLSYSMFAGTMSGTAANNGGLVGWGSATVDAKNCLIIANITTSPESSNIISRNSVTAKDCYFLTPYGGTPAGAYQITEDQLANGYVTYMLNSGKTRKDVVWRQNLDGSDIVPTLDPTHKVVYMTADSTYTNDIQNEIEKYEGTESDPYIINTPQDMALLRRFMLPGRVNYVKLGADIDMAEITSWTPLNMDGDKADGRNYQNIIDFDGQGHVISNFTCTDPNTSYSSFFGILNGNVRNVGFKNAVVTSVKTGTGILGGYIGHNDFQNADATKAYSKVENVWVTGQLTGSVDYIGGFFGTVAGPTVVKNCYSNIEIISDAPYVGGIAGRVRDQFHVDQAYAAGSITCANETAKVGGIIGGAQQNATEPGFYNNIVVWNNTDENFGPTIAAKEVTLPTADLLDVVFNADGTATDISPAQQEIEVVGQPKVAYSEKFGQNVFYSEANGNTPVSYLKIDYSENQELKDALTDGYTIETTIAIRDKAIPGVIKPFCATESGGFGFEITAAGQMKHINHTDIDGTKAYRYANTSVYAKMDTYYHLVGVYDKAARKVACYVNGINEATGSAEGTLHFPDNAQHQWIGIGADAGVQSGANFEIINARIYNEPITADMAKALYWKQNGRDFYAGDKVNNISFYNGSNFADLQNVVVNWGSPWKCDMTEGTYPTFDGTLSDGINNIESIAKGKIFNINGIQVEKTTKGLYIIDGKKVMVK